MTTRPRANLIDSLPSLRHFLKAKTLHLLLLGIVPSPDIACNRSRYCPHSLKPPKARAAVRHSPIRECPSGAVGVLKIPLGDGVHSCRWKRPVLSRPNEA